MRHGANVKPERVAVPLLVPKDTEGTRTSDHPDSATVCVGSVVSLQLSIPVAVDPGTTTVTVERKSDSKVESHAILLRFPPVPVNVER